MKYIMYCNNRKKKKYNSNSNSNNNNNKCYIVLLVILSVCLLNIVINNVSLSNEDIISKQEFQKLLDIKQNITGLKKISETMFELMFNTSDDETRPATVTANDSKEVKSTTAPNDVSMKENKGLGDKTTEEIMGDGGEREEEQEEKETKDEIKSNTGSTLVVSFAELMVRLTTLLQGIYNISLDTKNVQGGIVNMITRIPNICKLVLEGIYDVDDKVSLQPTKQEIAEIVNNAISSYNEANKKNTEELNKKIDEINKQNMKESNLYHTQMIQMLKDLTNKVDRLENGVQKDVVKTDTQSTTQTFINSSHSSKKVYIENISNEDLECEEDLIIKDKTTQNNEVVEAIKPVEMNGDILDETNVQQPLQEQDREIIGEQLQFDPSQIISLENEQISLINSCLYMLDREVRTLQDENEELLIKNNEHVLILKLIYNEEQKRMLRLQQTIDALKKYRENHNIETDEHIQFVKKCMAEQVSINENFRQLIRVGYKGMQYEQEEVTEDQKQQQNGEQVFDNTYNILKLAYQNIMNQFTNLNSELLALANTTETVEKEEVRKNVLSIDKIKEEILNAKLSSDMTEIENYDVIKKIFEDNFDIIVKACQDGKDINFIKFAESFLLKNEPENCLKINILNQLFNEIVKSKTQSQQELLNAQAEEATEEKSESEKISNQGNDAEGSQKPQDTLNVTEVNPKQPSTGKTPNAEQQELLNAQTEEVAEEEKSEQEKSVNAQELLQEQNELANAQEQQQTLNPIKQDNATMLKMGEQEEKSEQEKSTSAQAQPLQQQDVSVKEIAEQDCTIDMNRIVNYLNSHINISNNVQNELVRLIELRGKNQKTIQKELEYCLKQNMMKDVLITGMATHLERLNANSIEQLNKLRAARILEEQKALKEIADIDTVKRNMINITFTNGYELTEGIEFAASSEINIKEYDSDNSYDDLIKKSQNLRKAFVGLTKTKTMGELQ